MKGIQYIGACATVVVACLVALPGALTAQESVEGAKPNHAQQFARGAKAWSNNCARCHNMRDPRELRDDQWRAVMSHMRLRAGLTGQESRDILSFLQASN